MSKQLLRMVTIVGFVFFSLNSVSAQTPTDSRKRVATIFSKEIFLDQLEPDAERQKQMKGQLTEEQYREALLNFQNQRLSSLVWGPLMDRYCQNHPCEPTEEEIKTFNDRMDAQNAESRKRFETRKEQALQELQSPDLAEARKKEIGQELEQLETVLTSTMLRSQAEILASLSPEERAKVEAFKYDTDKTWVRQWKFNKALYDQYGGRIIFQQAGIEPLDAYRKWLEENERKGNFAIEDPEMKKKFWEYFLNDRMHAFIDQAGLEKSGLKNPFEKPWWLMEAKDEE